MVNLKDPQEDCLITHDILHSVGETNSCDFIDLKCQEKDCTNTKINSKQSNDHWHSVVSFNIKEDNLANNHKVLHSLGYNSNKSQTTIELQSKLQGCQGTTDAYTYPENMQKLAYLMAHLSLKHQMSILISL